VEEWDWQPEPAKPDARQATRMERTDLIFMKSSRQRFPVAPSKRSFPVKRSS